MDYEKILKDALNSKATPFEVSSWIEEQFPELKESEDEKIRKSLINYVYCHGDAGDFTKKEFIAWLKKQGEKKPVLDNALKEAFDKSRKDYSLEEKKEASDYSESIIPTSIACGESEEEYMLHKIIEAAYITGKNSMQNHVWNEEDETKLTTAETFIRNTSLIGNDGIKEATIDWLNDLKNRVQPKQDWSEEDENKIESIKGLITMGKFVDINTTKTIWNLLDSLRPQSHYKPSEKQMKQLGWIAEQNKDNMIGKELMALYQDLKRL